MMGLQEILTQKGMYILNSLEDRVKIYDKEGRLVFENAKLKEAMKEIPAIKKEVEETNFYPLSEGGIKDLETKLVEEKLINQRYYDVTTSPIIVDGEFMGLVQIYRDVTSETQIKIDLFEANKKMVEDIQFVRKIQANILPKNKSYDVLSLDGVYFPCEDISGDTYDLIKIEKGKYLFYIADVMGHGVKSSTMTMFLKATLSAIIESHPSYSPGRILKKLREKFVNLSIQSSQYFTICLGLFDLNQMTFSFANAGHNAPPLFLRDGQVDLIYSQGRMISNIIEEDSYREVEKNIRPGDTFLFYTDGLVEIKDRLGIPFGEERVKKFLVEGRSSQEIANLALDFSSKEIRDDISLVKIVIKEKK